ncbi:MAG: YegS/Rv2252/BmrU family lipid kinase [Ruminococcus sp.]|nr:YegS/Rv2252/BmrU family lipid kinase [Candidatus Copronaster equi]
MEGKKILLIINPCAGRNKKRIGMLDIINKLSSGNCEFTTKTTRCQGDATTIVKELGNSHDAIICCGGDGTVNEIVNGMMKIDRKIPLGYIPCGSTNDFAATLGIPVGLGPATDLILSGKKNGYDIGSLNGKNFCYVASFGVATDISYSTPQAMKNIFGHAAYMINGFVIRFFPMLKNFKPTHMRIEYDGGVIDDDIYFGSFSNSTSVAGLFKIDDVKLNDGYFELLLVKGLKKNTEMLTCLKRIIKKEYDGEQMMIVRTKKVHITSEKKVAWTLDGEFGGEHTDVTLEVHHNGVELYSENKELFLPREEAISE